MSKKTIQKGKNIFIFRDKNLSAEKSDELQENWLNEFHPDKIIIGGEITDDIIINEEGDSLMCMEYIEYED